MLNLNPKIRGLYFMIGYAIQNMGDAEMVCGQTRFGDQVDCRKIGTIFL